MHITYQSFDKSSHFKTIQVLKKSSEKTCQRFFFNGPPYSDCAPISSFLGNLQDPVLLTVVLTNLHCFCWVTFTFSLYSHENLTLDSDLLKKISSGSTFLTAAPPNDPLTTNFSNHMQIFFKKVTNFTFQCIQQICVHFFSFSENNYILALFFSVHSLLFYFLFLDSLKRTQVFLFFSYFTASSAPNTFRCIWNSFFSEAWLSWWNKVVCTENMMVLWCSDGLVFWWATKM